MIHYICDWCGEEVGTNHRYDPDWSSAYDNFNRRPVQTHIECGIAYRAAVEALLNGKQPRPKEPADVRQ